MGTTLTEVNKTLNRILDAFKSDKKTSERGIIIQHGERQVSFASTNSLLESIETLLTTLTNVDYATQFTLATIDSDTGNIINSRLLSDGNTNAFWVQQVHNHLKSNGTDNIHTLMDDLISDISTIDGVLDAALALHTTSDASLNEIESVLENEILDELVSIDANWNIGGVNNVALAAILVAVLNNATSGRQDTMNTHLGNIDSVLDDIETAVDGLETLQTSTNTKLDTVIQHLDDIDDHNYGTRSGSVINLTMTTGNLTQTMSLGTAVVNDIMALRITGEASAARNVTVSVFISGTNFFIITIAVAAGTTVEWTDTKFDGVRDTILNLKLTSVIEMRCVADAVTATESIVASFGIIPRVA